MVKKDDNYSNILENLIKLYEGYSNEYRGTTQPYYLEKVKKLVNDYQYNTKDKLIREPLLEHIGSLPLVMTTLYPYINDSEVDLGHALMLIAIHDIGELATGDEITFVKGKGRIDKEQEEALKLLNPYYHLFYQEVEKRTSKSAQFAKSIDKITPDILDYITPADITVRRYKELVKCDAKNIVSTIKEFKHPYMLWNEFMTNFHLTLLKKIDKKLSPYY